VFRPQFPASEPPPGYVDEDFVYYFDATNVPDLATFPAAGNSILKIPLQLQHDAPFILRAIEISGNTGPLGVRFTDPFGWELAADSIEADRGYSGTVNGANPVGRLPVMVEPEVYCPAGAVLLLDVTNLS
jgi:hypothetical protein